jgi:hypothetical protein
MVKPFSVIKALPGALNQLFIPWFFYHFHQVLIFGESPAGKKQFFSSLFAMAGIKIFTRF